MWEVVMGAASALTGVALTQFMQGRREAQGRFYDHRREAHMEFIKVFDGYWTAATRHTPYDEGPSPADLDAEGFDALTDRLLSVQVFASKPSHEAADKAVKKLYDFFSSDGKGDQEPLKSAFDDYLRLVRKELGVK
ncbi:hypothetical protein AB0D67_19530 [Streptosporangium sp. NPDC048047]|uniref:hypothetical protein n=1 Tax=Streptosporangium sp. NPDC048047 TaxID=3155748 RepID=UPI003414DF1B